MRCTRIHDLRTLRDASGHYVSPRWPYFPADEGMHGVLKDESFSVFSCWNGLAAVRADALIPVGHRPSPGHLSTDPPREPLPETHPLYATRLTSPAYTPALKFRSAAVSECRSVPETYLLIYDLRRLFGLSKIYVNPRVISGYRWPIYFWHNRMLKYWILRW